jgi:hypothetical protein
LFSEQDFHMPNKREREYETNENNETDESSNGISFVSLFSFVSYSLFISLVAALPRWVEKFPAWKLACF